MPSLQIRDLPQDLYERLRQAAQLERRSLAQEATVLLYRALGLEPSGKLRRQEVIRRIRQTQAERWPESLPSPAELIREDRGR
jgi:antitoxin FitA